MTLAEIESRLAVLEAEVSRLKGKKPQNPPHQYAGTGPIYNKEWLDQIRGSFAGDPAFLKAMEYGRKWRESQRPGARRKRKAAKASRR